jgi:hypothetical protein
MRSAALAILFAGAVLAATLARGPLFSRLPFERSPVEVLDTTFDDVDGAPVIDVRVRNNEGNAITGEIWFVVTRTADARPVYEHPPVAFGPLAPKQSAVLRLDRPGWVPADDFAIDVLVRETFNALVEPVPQLVPSSVTLREQGVEVTLRDVRLDRLRTMRDSARLAVALILANRGDAPRDYRVIFTLRPVLDPQGAIYQSPFQDVALEPGRGTVLNFEDQVVIAPGDYVLSGWLQVMNAEGLYEHVVKVDAPQILTVGG